MDPTIAVAFIAAAPATIAALAGWRNSKESKRIMQGNGKGSVDKMLEDVLDWQGRHDARHVRLEAEVRALGSTN